VADGIISDTEGCLDAFDVQSLRCEGGADLGDGCLSDAQIATLNTLASDNDLGFPIAGNSVAARFPVYNGGLLNLGRYHLGLTQVPHNPATSQDAWHYQVGDTNAKWFVTKDPTLNYLDFDLSANKDRVQELGTIMDTTDVSFRRAFTKRVKILMYTGMADDGVSPYNTIQLYDRVVGDLGQKKVDSFLRFYTIPGMSHGFGPFVAGWDSLTALRDWVEKGVAPGPQTVVDTNAATAGRTRPLCQYPTWPQFTGGDPNSAASFTCVS
jgi:feruloyl esterase